MVINENNSQINAFVKGMNSDTTYDQIDNQQYVYGKNIRITKNDFIEGSINDNNFSSLHEGIVSPLPEGAVCNFTNVQGTFLASDSINNIAVVITKSNNRLFVYKAIINNDATDQQYTDGFVLWWSCVIPSKLLQQFGDTKSVSTVMYQELEGVIKLYIATGIYPVIEMRVDGTTPYGEQNVDYFINNRILPTQPVYIDARIDGSLKTSQVQYTYRYYNKFGTTTQLAPLTNKIQVIDSNRSKETGNAQDTTTSVGFTLKIRNTNEYPAYGRLQIYRLQYIVPGEDANVALIYDGDVDTKTSGVTSFSFNDVGTTPLQELTMQEFAAMSGMVIIPKVIEQNQQYMFASNVKDDTIIEASIPSTVISKKQFQVKLSTSTSSIPTQDESSNNEFSDSSIREYFEERNINPSLPKNTYNDIFTSSLLRSLRRGESYKYGIVYYDKYGRHTNVLKLENQQNDSPIDPVPEINDNSPITQIVSDNVLANTLGVSISIPTPMKDGNPIEDIVGCQIVRRSCKPMYQKTLLQVAIAKTIAQDLYTIAFTGEQWDQIRRGESPTGATPKLSPYYPTGFLLSNPVSTVRGYYETDAHGSGYCPAYTRDNKLYQAFSNEFDFRRDDILSRLKSYSLYVKKVANYTLQSDNSSYYTQQASKNIDGHLTVPTNLEGLGFIFSYPGISFTKDPDQTNNISYINIDKLNIYQSQDKKPSEYMMFPLYYYNTATSEKKSIRSVKDVKIPEWFDGFSNIQIDGTKILAGGIKKYQQFTTSIDDNTFNNWISFGLYDFKISDDDAQQNIPGTDTQRGYSQFLDRDASDWRFPAFSVLNTGITPHRTVSGYIGPGTSCFLFTMDEDNLTQSGFGAALCNIQHDISTIDNEPDEFVQYFGFGNFFPLAEKRDQSNNLIGYKVAYKNDGAGENVVSVFDGDIYITPHEIATMYKTYDFTSTDTLWSMQVINYVPMESKVNTFFDYGMNFLNTNSANIMSEPGSIDGITTQDRPVHQYNQIYSANDESNDVFTLVVEKAEDNNFKQRTYYSEPKTNGEYVDNFVIFKPAAYIDVDPKYGEVTNLLTDKNTLYYWQNTAFGKFSVNERSLINDTNGNTIMLGQAGILSRNDYISTKYGMRPYDYCATCAENGVYWVDVNNKAIVGGNTNECVNIGERLNVQNILNSKMDIYTPRVDYDLQNNELLCKCLQDGEQMIFNLKINIATSIYTRSYEDIITVQNHVYGYNSDSIIKYNHLTPHNQFMTPMILSFVVNASSSTTKVFDSQQLTPIKRKNWNEQNTEDYTSFFEDSSCTLSFETDINKTSNNIEAYTDREGNIVYNIPRFGNDDWGNRLRGKWMRVNMNYGTPTEYTTISHVITKFRQSYS